jgi:hypothetical protein
MRKAIVCTMLIGLLTACGWAAKATSMPPNFSGTWNIDIFKSVNLPFSHIIVSQDETSIHFDYFQGKKKMAAETFILDGRERPRWENNITRGYARAKFEKGQLVITTRVVTDQQGDQSYMEVDKWVMSPDGSTLTNKPADGKTVIYVRKKEPAEAPGGTDQQSPAKAGQK